jgi:aspartate/methionine/tyrosine aminotransferase
MAEVLPSFKLQEVRQLASEEPIINMGIGGPDLNPPQYLLILL